MEHLLNTPYDVLLLDEPTNHLSTALVEELEDALNAYDVLDLKEADPVCH
ncbi:hypothetical protein ACIBL3_02245 [Kribbella sp. NPDC050124]